MRDFLINIFREDKVVLEITLFSIWHIMYIVLIVGGTIGLSILLNKKASEKTRNLVRKIIACALVCVYIADFFIMPLSRDNGQIDIDKLPFHICTIMGIVIPFVEFNKKFEKIKEPASCLAVVASLMYITYPGSALGGISTFCYKVVQTFVYHGLLFAYGYLAFSTKFTEMKFKNIWKCLVGIIMIALWAALGNATYSNADHHYDWFFITGSTFPFIPSWLMPFVVVIAVFGMCAIIYSIDLLIKKVTNKKEA